MQQHSRTPVVRPCHDGCDVQVGVAVEPCGLLLGAVEHAGGWTVGDCGEPEWTEPWTEEHRCGWPKGHGDDVDHDSRGEPVVWRTDVPWSALESGKTYGFRARHRDADGLTSWSPAAIVRTVEPSLTRVTLETLDGSPAPALFGSFADANLKADR